MAHFSSLSREELLKLAIGQVSWLTGHYRASRLPRAFVMRVAGACRLQAPKNPAFRSIEDLENLIKNGAVFYIARENDSIAGCIAIQQNPNNETMFFLERLAVLPEHRHKGYGRLLVEKAFKECQALGGTLVSIGIVDENSCLKNWYGTLGFKETGTKKFPHLPFTVCFMEKKL